MTAIEVKPNFSIAHINRSTNHFVEGCAEGSLVRFDGNFGLVVIDSTNNLRLVWIDRNVFLLVGPDDVIRNSGPERLLVFGSAVVQPAVTPTLGARAAAEYSGLGLLVGTCGLMLAAHGYTGPARLFRLDTAREVSSQPTSLLVVPDWSIGVRNVADTFVPLIKVAASKAA